MSERTGGKKTGLPTASARTRTRQVKTSAATALARGSAKQPASALVGKAEKKARSKAGGTVAGAVKAARPLARKPVRVRAAQEAGAVKQVHVLIIDDELGKRMLPYQRLFAKLADRIEEFQVVPHWADQPGQVREALGRDGMDLIVLDMNLTQNSYADHSDIVYSALRNDHRRIPLILLSSDFSSDESVTHMHTVLHELKGMPILGFMPYVTWVENYTKRPNEEISERQADVWRKALSEAYESGKDYHFKLNEPDTVTFLHLTDTHFGKIEPDYLEARAIATGAHRDALAADILIWTGDVSDRAAPADFRQAEAFLDSLRKHEVIAKTTPICMTPGNHDLNWPLALASRARIGRAGGGHEADWKWEIGEAAVDEELWSFGYRPYADFFQRVVQQECPQLSGQGYRWLDQWSHLGFAILELPIEGHVIRSAKSQTNPAPCLSAKEFDRITASAFDAITASRLGKQVCIILLLHGAEPEGSAPHIEQWKRLRSQLHDEGYPVLIFAGHVHKSNYHIHRRELTVVGTPMADRAMDGAPGVPGIMFVTLGGLNTAHPICTLTRLERVFPEDQAVARWEARQVGVLKINASEDLAPDWAVVRSTQPSGL